MFSLVVHDVLCLPLSLSSFYLPHPPHCGTSYDATPAPPTTHMYLPTYLHRGAPPRPGRTEIITNDQSPNFTAQFSLTYLFEEVQRVRLEVYDVDTSYKSSDATKLDLGKQDFQGEIKKYIYMKETASSSRGKSTEVLHTRGESTYDITYGFFFSAASSVALFL